jgi:hypothetical protein
MGKHDKVLSGRAALIQAKIDKIKQDYISTEEAIAVNDEIAETLFKFYDRIPAKVRNDPDFRDQRRLKRMLAETKADVRAHFAEAHAKLRGGRSNGKVPRERDRYPRE